jgi:N utilization substance protein A
MATKSKKLTPEEKKLQREREKRKELKDSVNALVKEKGIPKEALIETIQNSLLTACKYKFGSNENIAIEVDPETFEIEAYFRKEVVASEDDMYDSFVEITLEDARKIDPSYEVGDVAKVPIDITEISETSRIAAHNAKGVIVQKLKEEERKIVFNEYIDKVGEVVVGVYGRDNGRFVNVNIGTVDAMLMPSDRVRYERFKQGDRVKVLISKVEDTPKGPRVLVSRKDARLVKKLFEQEVTEIKEGYVEIKAIAREEGSRTKMAVYSHDKNIDAVGSCVGINGQRVNAVVEELQGEKIDIINWDDDPGSLIENALAPAKVIVVAPSEEEKEALVVVPDDQLSLAIGKGGQNAKLAAHLTGYRIDIKAETQAVEDGIFDAIGINYDSSLIEKKPVDPSQMRDEDYFYDGVDESKASDASDVKDEEQEDNE